MCDKKCSVCNETKDVNLFYIKGSICKECTRQRSRIYKCIHKEQDKKRNSEYYKKNSESLKRKTAEYRKSERGKETIKEYEKNKRYADPGKKLDRQIYMREYNKKNPKSVDRDSYNAWWRNHYKTNTNFRLGCLYRRRLNEVVKKYGCEKSSMSFDLVGCSIDELRKYLNETAKRNGYLDFDIHNYNGYEYHIDHIVPCDFFDLKNDNELRKCFHYTNLQILRACENLEKGCKI